jgi:hypothetical protein
MVISDYFVNDYWWLLMPILLIAVGEYWWLLMTINDYFINGFWCLLMVILLVGYFFCYSKLYYDYWWLFCYKLLFDIIGYIIIGYW